MSDTRDRDGDGGPGDGRDGGSTDARDGVTTDARDGPAGDGPPVRGAVADTIDRYAVGPDSTHEEFLAAAKLYARDVVDRHDLAVDVSRLEWEVSTRAKRRAGAVTYSDGDPRTVRLTWAHFQNEGWSAAAATVRHELIHVHLLNEAGDASHGDAFRRLADRLETHVHCERFVDPEWWVTCVDCGARLARYRRSKLVQQPERYQCGDCGGAFRVERAE